MAAVALALGIALLFSLVTLALFFAMGGPFGALNDWSIGVSGVLAVTFVLAIRATDVADASVDGVILRAVAVVGDILVVVGAWLVISDTTGFLLAGLVESLGFALFGCWLIALSRSMAPGGRWPPRLPTLGYATGILLVIGLIVAPGIVMGLDDMDTRPGGCGSAMLVGSGSSSCFRSGRSGSALPSAAHPCTVESGRGGRRGAEIARTVFPGVVRKRGVRSPRCQAPHRRTQRRHRTLRHPPTSGGGASSWIRRPFFAVAGGTHGSPAHPGASSARRRSPGRVAS